MVLFQRKILETSFLDQISLLLMYLFSMPLAEALAGYQRYEKTIVLFLVGCFTIFLLAEWLVSPRRLGKASAVFCGLYGAIFI